MKIKENIVLVATLLAAICSIFMFWLGWDMGEKSYSIKDDTLYTEEDLTGSYNVGYEDGLRDAEEASMASHIEIVENWICNLETIYNNNGTIHIIDKDGEEWVLVADNCE